MSTPPQERVRKRRCKVYLSVDAFETLGAADHAGRQTLRAELVEQLEVAASARALRDRVARLAGALAPSIGNGNETFATRVVRVTRAVAADRRALGAAGARL